MEFVNYFSVDYYPIKEIRPLAWVAQMMDEMYIARRRCFNKPVLWMTLELWDGWGWNPETGDWTNYPNRASRRCPTEPEYECMTYLALTHGAKGLLYFAFPSNMAGGYRPPSCPPDRDPPVFFDNRVWGFAKRINDELEQLSYLINMPESDHVPDVVISEGLMPFPRLEPLGTLETMTGENVAFPGPGSASSRSDVGTDVCDSLEPIGDQEQTRRTVGGTIGEQLPDIGDRFGFSIHCLGMRSPTQPGQNRDRIIKPKRASSYYYLICVNARNFSQRVRFECHWVPGFHGDIPAMELVPPIEVMFENRQILAEIPPDQGMTGGPFHRIVFHDTFEGYRRHVYKIPREGFDPRMIPPDDPGIVPYLFITQLSELLIERLNMLA